MKRITHLLPLAVLLILPAPPGLFAGAPADEHRGPDDAVVSRESIAITTNPDGSIDITIETTTNGKTTTQKIHAESEAELKEKYPRIYEKYYRVVEPQDVSPHEYSEDMRRLLELLERFGEFDMEEFGRDESHFRDFFEKFRNLEEFAKGLEMRMRAFDVLRRLEAGLWEALLEKRDFHYTLKLGGIEYQLTAMNRSTIEGLGLMVENVSPALEAQLGLDGKGGVLVVEVEEEGPAAKAGLKRHDILMSIGGGELLSIAEIENVLGALPDEDEFTCKIMRRAEEMEIKMTFPEGWRENGEADDTEEEEEDAEDLPLRDA